MKILLKSEVIDLVWNQAEALALYNKFKATWSKSREFGITGGPDAGTGAPNSPTLFAILQNHGKGNKSRKGAVVEIASLDFDGEVVSFYGVGDVLEQLEEIINQKTIRAFEVDILDSLLEVMEEIENDKSYDVAEASNPRNIPFQTVLAFDEDTNKVTQRGKMYGHFLTPAMWKYKKYRAKMKKREYNVEAPQASWSSKDPNRARPPMWLAMFDKTDGLKTLIENIKKIMEESMTPEPGASYTVTFNQRKVGRAATLTNIRALLEKVLNDASIYVGNQKSPRKGRLREAIEKETLQVTDSDLDILSEVTEVIVVSGDSSQKMKLADVPNYQDIEAVNLRFPPGNHRTLNELIREVMGEEFMNTFRRPGLPEGVSDGLTLKAEVEMIEHATELMRKMLILKARDRFFTGINIPKWIGDLAPPGQRTRNVNITDDIILTDHAIVRLQGLDDQSGRGRNLEIAWYIEDAIKIIQQKIDDGSYPKMTGRDVPAYKAYFIVIGDGKTLGTIGVFSPEHEDNDSGKYVMNYITDSDKSTNFDRFSVNIRPVRTDGPAWEPDVDTRPMHSKETWAEYIRNSLSEFPEETLEDIIENSFNSSIAQSFRALSYAQNKILEKLGQTELALRARREIQKVIDNSSEYNKNYRERMNRVEREEARAAAAPRQRRRQTQSVQRRGPVRTSYLGQRSEPTERQPRETKPRVTAARGRRKAGEREIRQPPSRGPELKQRLTELLNQETDGQTDLGDYLIGSSTYEDLNTPKEIISRFEQFVNWAKAKNRTRNPSAYSDNAVNYFQSVLDTVRSEFQ